MDSKMYLAEKNVCLNNIPLREIRRLSGGHQTSVITTNKKLSILMVALYMFSRWTQENFFKYLRQGYDFDRLLQYAVEQIDGDFTVNSPGYNNITYKIGKTREKISRRKAILFELQEDNLKDNLDNANQYLKKQIKVRDELKTLELLENDLLSTRSQVPSQVKIKDMPDSITYNKLNIESKCFQNIIKMICYRAETSCANLIFAGFKKGINEKRTLVKSMVNAYADIEPDESNNQLVVKLYSLANPRMNNAMTKLIELLNEMVKSLRDSKREPRSGSTMNNPGSD
jgi:hypothetical protein